MSARPCDAVLSRRPTSESARLERSYLLYRKRLARCRTVNQVNRLHILLTRYMTPMELRYFGTASASEPSDSVAHRVWQGHAKLLPIRKLRPVEFGRQGGYRGVSFFTGNAGSPSQKTLIIAFTGAFHRVMLPTFSFLDCLNPAFHDVLMLRDFERCLFIKGIEGLGADFFEAMHSLRNRFAPHLYRRTIALGTSSGGTPALLASMLLQLDRAVSIGGTDYSHMAALLSERGISEEPYARLLASRPDPFPDLLIVYGAAHRRDSAAAHAIHSRLPSRLLGVEDCSSHGVLAKELEKGSLPQFLTKIFGQSLEDDEPIVMRQSVGGLTK